MGDVVVAEAEPVVVAQQADQADHQCRRGSETRSWGCGGAQRDVDATRLIELRDPPDRALDEVEVAVVLDWVLAVVLESGVEIERLDRDPMIVPRTERPVGVAVDRGAEDEAALTLEERRHVGAAAGEGDP